MVAILSSNVVLIAVVAGIPALAVLLVILWSLPGRKALAGGATVVALTLAGLAVWAVFRPSGPPATASALPPPAATSAAGPPSQGPPGSCQPSGAELHVVAKALAFNPTCLAAPAGKAFSIAFDNQDPSIPHNLHILESDPASSPSAASLFAGALVTGPKTETYQVNALPKGTYYFQCDVHPSQMKGTFVVA